MGISVMLHSHQHCFSMIRRTYGSVARGVPWPCGNYNLSTRVVFALGSAGPEADRKVQEEARQHGDIVQGTVLWPVVVRVSG